MNYGYAHVKDGGYCGELLQDNTLSTQVQDVEQCAALVSGAGGTSFIFGVSFANGKCIMGDPAVTVDQGQFETWQGNKKNPECEAEGGWHMSVLYDFYAMEPVQE